MFLILLSDLRSCLYEGYVWKRPKHEPTDRELTPVGAKMLDPKAITLPTDSSKLKEKVPKDYLTEDLKSDTS